MSSSAPVSHKEEAQKLTADAIVPLFTIKLKNYDIVFRFKDTNEVTWQGKKFEAMACKLTGDEQSADGEDVRPMLQIVNPIGIFNKPARDGLLDQAIVIRQEVLLKHLTGNVNIYEQRMWQVGRVREIVSGQSISLELRNMTEGANFQIPIRQFMPPEFPLVSLS